MFKPYFRSTDSKSQSKNKNGHGLGLSICKKIVQGMGGTLEVTSDITVGSTFTIFLQSEVY
jgi:signal transduction histidine kinase